MGRSPSSRKQIVLWMIISRGEFGADPEHTGGLWWKGGEGGPGRSRSCAESPSSSSLKPPTTALVLIAPLDMTLGMKTC